MSRTAFIIGGTGQIGIAVAAALLRDGWQVRLAHAGRHEARNIPAGADRVTLDRRDIAALETALGAGVDALIDTMAFNGADADQLLGLAGRYGQLAVISTASVYEDDAGRSLETADTLGLPRFAAPRPEQSRTVAPSPESYSSAKMALESRLREASTRPVAILRPCAVHGINSRHPREWWFVKRMLDGRRRIPLAGNPEARFHTSATANIAALLVAALGRAETLVLNAGDPDPPSIRQIGETIAAELGWDGSFVPVAADAPVGHTPFSVPHDFLVSMAAAEAIGYRPAGSYVETLRPYLDWMRREATDWRTAFPVFAGYPSDPFDYAAENDALG